MYKLFIDDERIPKQVTWIEMPLGPWVIVRNYLQFVEYITRNGLPMHVSFDHDLSMEHYPAFEPDGGIYAPKVIPYEKYKELTGFSCAKWLVEYCIENHKQFPSYTVHSMNPIGSENIKSYIESFKRQR